MGLWKRIDSRKGDDHDGPDLDLVSDNPRLHLDVMHTQDGGLTLVQDRGRHPTLPHTSVRAVKRQLDEDESILLGLT
jgi:hypothetical protein